MNDADTLDTHLQEVRRGTVVLACLQLLQTAGYGCKLLEKLGYLTSEWNTEEARPRKFYCTSSAGIRLATTLTTKWHLLTTALASLTETKT